MFWLTPPTGQKLSGDGLTAAEPSLDAGGGLKAARLPALPTCCQGFQARRDFLSVGAKRS